MKIAIIGGGTAGIVSAWLLDERHDVTLLERDTVLGGNIRTLGGNVPCARLPGDIRLDAGVVEFDRVHFKKFHALMRMLGVEMAEVPITTGLFLADGSAWHAPARLVCEFPGTFQRIFQKIRHLPVKRSEDEFLARTEREDSHHLREATIGDFVGDDVFGKWIKMLLMYGYSMPYEKVGEIGAALAVPTLRRFLISSDWTRVVGGVWTYVEKILARLRARVVTGAQIESVVRTDDSARVVVAGQGAVDFDAVVFAVTPDQVLAILTDPSADEHRRFASWRANRARTVVHCDTGLYERRGIRYYSEFDLFECASGAHGYNAYLNRLCGIPPDSESQYSLAFELDEEINPARVIHEQCHITPLYDVDSLRWRDEVVDTNGENRVWYAGAWLGDGLQEGAVTSAERVSIGLGGRTIDP